MKAELHKITITKSGNGLTAFGAPGLGTNPKFLAPCERPAGQG